MTNVYGTNIKLTNTTFYNNKTITSVDCNNREWVNNSMSSAFYNCQNLVSVPTSLPNITNMRWAFGYCSNLSNFPLLPNSVIDLSYTFYKCQKLTVAPTIPNSVTNMHCTFEHCKNLTVAPTIPNSVTDISNMFKYCYNLTSVPTIPNSVTNIAGAFTDCYNLTSVPTIPNSVTNIAGAFSYCTNLIGYINIASTEISNAEKCFTNMSDIRNVSIPFKYSNNVYTKTYNAFTNAGYTYLGNLNNVYLKDINNPVKIVVNATGNAINYLSTTNYVFVTNIVENRYINNITGSNKYYDLSYINIGSVNYYNTTSRTLTLDGIFVPGVEYCIGFINTKTGSLSDTREIWVPSQCTNVSNATYGSIVIGTSYSMNIYLNYINFIATTTSPTLVINSYWLA